MKDVNEILESIINEVKEQSYLTYDDNPRRAIDEIEVIEIINKYKAVN